MDAPSWLTMAAPVAPVPSGALGAAVAAAEPIAASAATTAASNDDTRDRLLLWAEDVDTGVTGGRLVRPDVDLTGAEAAARAPTVMGSLAALGVIPTAFRRRPRDPVEAVDPPRRALYRLVARQLLSDGYADAAHAVMRSTGVSVPDAATILRDRTQHPYGSTATSSSWGPVVPGVGHVAGTGAPGDAQRLMHLVQRGIWSEAVNMGSAGGAWQRGMIEEVVLGYDPYTTPLPPATVRLTQQYMSIPMQRAVRTINFSAEGDLVAVGTAGGVIKIFSTQLAAEHARFTAARGLQEMTDAAVVRVLAPPAPLPPVGGPRGAAAASAAGEIPPPSCEWVGFHPHLPVVCSGYRDGRLGITKYSDPLAIGATPMVMLPSSGPDAFAIRTAAFHPDGAHILYGTDDRTVRLMDLETGAVFTPSAAPSVLAGTLAPAGTGLSGSASVAAAPVALLPSLGTTKMAAGGPGADSSGAGLSGRAALGALEHSGSITSVSISSSGRHFASASYDGSIAIYDGRRGRAVHQIPRAHCSVAVTSVEFSRSGYMLLSCGLDSLVKVWDIRKLGAGGIGRALRHRGSDMFGAAGGVGAATTSTAVTAIAAAARRLMASSSDAAEVLSLRQPVRAPGGHMLRAHFSHDERAIIAHAPDASGAHVLDPLTGAVVAAVDCSGRADAGSATGSSTTDGTRQRTIRGLAASPSSMLIATGGEDLKLQLWGPAI
jgi:WD40 repeat protein